MQDAQNMQNMINMMNNFMGSQMQQPIAFDPSKIDRQFKRALMNHTIAQTKIGLYKSFPKFKSLSSPYVSNFNPGPPNNICDVSVMYEHVLDVAEQYAEKGMNYGSNNNMNPVVLNIVGREFTGNNLETNENIRDEIINIRTTFNNSIGTGNIYPMKEDECVYCKIITVIRPKNPASFLPYQQTYRTAMITAAPIPTDELLSDNKMNANDFVKTCTVIECVFQTAISTRHTVLILSPFGHEEDNNPVEDIIKIYNYCILKYGHLFKKIIIGVPPHYPKGIYQAYSTGIIKPNEVVASVDKKYEQEELKKNLIERGVQEQLPPSKNKDKKKKNEIQNPNNGFTQEQMEMFMNMMSMMNKNQ